MIATVNNYAPGFAASVIGRQPKASMSPWQSGTTRKMPRPTPEPAMPSAPGFLRYEVTVEMKVSTPRPGSVVS